MRLVLVRGKEEKVRRAQELNATKVAKHLVGTIDNGRRKT